MLLAMFTLQCFVHYNASGKKLALQSFGKIRAHFQIAMLRIQQILTRHPTFCLVLITPAAALSP
jgi:hypothetical protein